MPRHRLPAARSVPITRRGANVPVNWSIVSLAKIGPRHRTEAAEILVAEFREHWPGAWPTLESAEAEVAEALDEGRLAFAAVEKGGPVLGWIGARPSYGGTVWELHPLAVRRHAQGKGIGRSLVEHLEAEIRGRPDILMARRVSTPPALGQHHSSEP